MEGMCRCACTGIIIILALVTICGSEIVKSHGQCCCGIFDPRVPNAPLLDHALPLNVTRDDEGSQKCMQLCSALAEAAKDRAPALICEILKKRVENVQVSLQSRICDDGEWKFTGIQRKDAICCDAGKEFQCDARSPE